MIVSKQETIKRYPNGNISYVETKAIISPIYALKCPNHRISSDGKLWIRVGVNKKYNPEGKLRWEIKYDDCGNVVK